MVDDKFYVILDEAYGSAAGTVNLNFNITEGTDAQVVYDTSEGGFHRHSPTATTCWCAPGRAKSGAYVQKTGFVSLQHQPDCGRKAYQLNLEKTADEPVVRYATVLLPTSDASAEEVSITLGDWSETGGSVRAGRGGFLSCVVLYPVTLKPQ